jgi:hypothetical protein
MPDKAEKRRRRTIIAELRAKEDQEARAKKPVPDDVLLALFRHLESTLFLRVDGRMVTKCDHTLDRSRIFLEEAGLNNVEAICDWFGEFGGFCDCEVAYNVADYWESRLTG